MFVYHFVDPDVTVKIISRKEEIAENEGIDFDIRDVGTSAYWYWIRLEVLEEEFFCSPWRDWKGACRKLLSLLKLYQRFWI